MKSLVWAKYVPDTNSPFRLNGAGTWVDEANLSFNLNEYDRYALEELLKLKDEGKVSEVVALTVGPAEWASVSTSSGASSWTGACRARLSGSEQQRQPARRGSPPSPRACTRSPGTPAEPPRPPSR